MWYDLGQHDYALYASAQQKHLQMRDDGHKTRVKIRGHGARERFVVQIWSAT
jgi:hypothetical protein